MKGEGIVAGTTITAMYTLTGSLTGNGGIGTYFGKSVCLDKEGTIIAIGAPETDLVNPGFFQIWNLQ